VPEFFAITNMDPNEDLTPIEFEWLTVGNMGLFDISH